MPDRRFNADARGSSADLCLIGGVLLREPVERGGGDHGSVDALGGQRLGGGHGQLQFRAGRDQRNIAPTFGFPQDVGALCRQIFGPMFAAQAGQRLTRQTQKRRGSSCRGGDFPRFGGFDHIGGADHA